MRYLNKIRQENQFQRKVLIGCAMMVGLFFLGLTLYRYQNYVYTGLDLAIFNQVAWNSSRGDWFMMTIHQNSYLGDHFSPIFFLIIPIYSILPHPVVLLWVQVIMLVLPVWPIFKVAKEITDSKNLAYYFAGAYLFYPIIHSIILDEFHLLPLTIFFFFWLIYFLLKREWRGVIIIGILLLSCREDAGLLIFSLGVYLLLFKNNVFQNQFRKKTRIWLGLAFMGSSLGWMAFGQLVISHFSADGGNKFIFHYSWLGQTLDEIWKTIIAEPQILIPKIFSVYGVLLLAYLLVPLFLLGFFGWREMTMIIIPYLQYALTNPGIRDAFFSHYLSLFVGPIFLASMAGMVFLKKKLPYVGRWEKIFGYILMGFILISSTLVLGPVRFQVKAMGESSSREKAATRNSLAKMVADEDSILLSEDWLSKLSSRKEVFATHYSFLGKEQYSSRKFELPELDGALINFEEMLLKGSMMDNYNRGAESSLKDEYYVSFAEGGQNIWGVIEEQNLGAVRVLDDLVYLKRNEGEKLIEVREDGRQSINGERPIAVRLTTKKIQPKMEMIEGREMKFLPIRWRWVVRGKIETDLLYELRFKNSRGEVVWKKLYSPAYGLYPTSLWKPGEEIEVRRNFLAPTELGRGRYFLEIELVEANLSPSRDVTGNLRLEEDIRRFDQPISLGEVEIN